MSLHKKIEQMLKLSRQASSKLGVLSSEEKNSVLKDMADCLRQDTNLILSANAKDMSMAIKKKMPASLVDRLTLNEKRIAQMVDSLEALIKLDDPVGQVLKTENRPNGLKIEKVRVPIGVIFIIYESRPNVTSDCAGLCFKSGNAVILRGGSESFCSNAAILKSLKRALEKHNLPASCVNMVDTTDRRAVDILLKAAGQIDLVIPRGGESLIKKVVETSRIPVIKHYKGICHVYVDEEADLNMAESICFNAKVQRPGVCNAMETMLVHRDAAARFIPGMAKRLIDAGVQIRGCALTRRIARNLKVKSATDKDYHTEYLGLILSVKVVDSLYDAIQHINHYGSGHSDAIITDNYNNSEVFLKEVDSACVYVNASTRFTDGYQFGMGAEIGISTDKIHARGPMALEELTSYKYQVYGNGQIRN
ncbi:MAG: glutamate-5-semialdehyde dehydrogenase [Candidatus Omnitrophica bacterium]|jgi:glutamate-5-semialdehyde dehydrogenase|nr:glutamate-5-semialdehyde dehydrogenase [Candidatus Omnitrophota bacterium]